MTRLTSARSANSPARTRDHIQIVATQWVVSSPAMRFLRVVMPSPCELVMLVIKSRARVQVSRVDAWRVIATVAGFLVVAQRAAEGRRQDPSRREHGAPAQAKSAVPVRVSCAPPRMTPGRARRAVREGLESLGVRHAVLNDSHVSGARIASLAPSQVMCSAVPARVSSAGARGDRTGRHESIIASLNNYRRYLTGEGTAAPSPVTE